MWWGNLLWIRIVDFFFSTTSTSVSLSEDPAQIGKGISLITVLDINDNAPEFAIDYETLLCENTLPGQVSPLPLVFPSSVKPPLLFLFTWMFTHKDNPLTVITMIKSLFFCTWKKFRERACLPHSLRSFSKASLVWVTSQRPNNVYGRCYPSLDILLSFHSVYASLMTAFDSICGCNPQ